MIKLLNGELWEEEAILKKMVDDSFYYGHLGKERFEQFCCEEANR